MWWGSRGQSVVSPSSLVTTSSSSRKPLSMRMSLCQATKILHHLWRRYRTSTPRFPSGFARESTLTDIQVPKKTFRTFTRSLDLPSPSEISNIVHILNTYAALPLGPEIGKLSTSLTYSVSYRDTYYSYLWSKLLQKARCSFTCVPGCLKNRKL